MTPTTPIIHLRRTRRSVPHPDIQHRLDLLRRLHFHFLQIPNRDLTVDLGQKDKDSMIMRREMDFKVDRFTHLVYFCNANWDRSATLLSSYHVSICPTANPVPLYQSVIFWLYLSIPPPPPFFPLPHSLVLKVLVVSRLTFLTSTEEDGSVIEEKNS